MVQEKFETGMYIVDEHFRIVNVNDTMKQLYPSVKVGDLCYQAIALQDCQCAVCPLLADDALFYNPLRKEWINANAALIDYPGHGPCYNVQFHIRSKLSKSGQETLQDDNMDEHIIELSGGTLDACAIGGYCEPGSPLSYANEQMIRLMGYDSLEEMRQAVDGLVFNTIHPDDVERVTADLTHCALSGGRFETTYRLHRKDRTWLWVVARGKRVQTASGAYVLFCVITDMTEFVQRQHALQQENELLMQRGVAAEAALTHMPSGYHRCSMEAGYPFLFVSRSFEAVVGYTWEQMRTELDNKFISLVLPEDLPRFAQLGRDLADHGTIDVIYRIRRRDGQVRWVQDSAMIIQWDGVPCLQCTVSDITDFVRQQEEFASQRAQFDLVAERIPCGYHRCAVTNGFALEFVSDSFLEITGFDREELIGRPFFDMIYPGDREDVRRHVGVLSQQGREEMVYRILRKDGSVRWVKDCAMRIQYDGKDSYQSILADITEHVEGLNEARLQAEASNQAKSAFLFNASHDIRTPMNAIKGFAHIIEQNADDPAIVRRTVEKLKRSGDVLLTLMDDVLELSRIEQGRERVNLLPMNMQTHVEKLCEMMAQEMEKSGLAFRMENSIAHPLVIADDLKLTRIAMNYLSNARKFTPAGGAVTFGVEESGWDGETAVYTLWVRDTGIGMSREFQAHAFEQFERERTSTASGVSGSGLGLSITRKLALLLGGECAIQSELGKGTAMRCSIRLKVAGAEAFQPPAAQPTVDFAGLRILLVEDNEFNREIARYVFEGLGCRVEEAVNGMECLNRLSNAPAGAFDLILMDIQMPVMDGYKATEEIRRYEDPAIRRIPIVAMTANAFEEDRKRCLAVGMDGHIAKPLDAGTAQAELMRVLACRK